jgi:GMP synthase-like glutamine amidotransferase
MTTSPAVLLHPTEVVPRIDPHPRLIDPTRVVRHPALVVQPRRERPARPLVDVLLAHDLDPVVVAADDDDSLPDPGASPVAILVGRDPLSDARVDGRLQRELEWVGRADAAGTAVLGIGHGARVLALAFGGAVQPAQRPLRGWSMVETIVPHVIPSGPWLAWQHDVITLPPGAQLLAHNRLGPQAFRIGRHLAVQFHPEATPDALAGWPGAADASAGADTPVVAIKRDPGAAAVCSWRVLASFVGAI